MIDQFFFQIIPFHETMVELTTDVIIALVVIAVVIILILLTLLVRKKKHELYSLLNFEL